MPPLPIPMHPRELGGGGGGVHAPLLVPWGLCHLQVSWVSMVTAGAVTSAQLALLWWVFPKGTPRGGAPGWGAQAGSCPGSPDPAAFLFAFPGAEGSAKAARPPLTLTPRCAIPAARCLGTACPLLDGWQRVTRGGPGPPAGAGAPHGGPLGRLAVADAPGHLPGRRAWHGWQEGDQHGWGPGDRGPLPCP